MRICKQCRAQAALNIGVTMWTQELAEHHAAIAATDSADEGLQMSMQMTERLSEAQRWMETARECNMGDHDVGGIISRGPHVLSIELEANMSLACIAFLTSQQAKALNYLRVYLGACMINRRNWSKWCFGCWQVREQEGKEALLTCSGCSLARSLLKLL